MKKIIFFICIIFQVFFSYQTYSGWYDFTTQAYSTSSPVGGNCGGSSCNLESVPHVTVCPWDNEFDDWNIWETLSAVSISWLPVVWWSTINNWPEYVAQNGTMDCWAWDGTSFDKSYDILTANPSNWSHLLANNSLNIDFSIIDRGGAPIKDIKLRVEEVNNNDIYWSPQTITWPYPSLVGVDFSQVDNDTTSNDGYRNYRMSIDEICDTANNCISSIWYYIFDYYVVANSNSILADVITNELTSLDFANGSTKTLTVSLQDNYNNKLIPVSKSWFSRSIDLNFDVNNTLQLNQYLLNGRDAVFLDTPSDPGNFINRLSYSNNFNNLPSDTWEYSFNFKTYAPTFKSWALDGRENAVWDFIINNINYDINQTFSSIWAQLVNNSYTDVEYKPIYTSNFSDDPWNTIWFIEWATQSGTLVFNKNSTCSLCANEKWYLEFWKNIGEGVNNIDLYVSSPTSVSIGEWNWNKTQITSSYGIYTLSTLLTQSWGYIDEIDNSYISSHISYDVDGKNVTYNTDVIGKSNYWSTSSWILATQTWLKVYGMTQSQNQQDITLNQEDTDIHLLWKNNKAWLKQDIISKSFSLVKEVQISNNDYVIDEVYSSKWNSLQQDAWVILNEGSVLYFWSDSISDIVELSPSSEYTGRKTILVIGKDLYITNNIITSNITNNLWIIVLKDKNGNGGNVYIDPDVTQIHATIFSDKSLMSYTDILWELWWWTSQYTLRNQLYIKWSVFSENTIGGSKATPPICPYYVDTFLCTWEEAQKYDINYLRRYYLDDSGNPVNWWIQVFTTSPKNQYPVIFEYNPSIQSFPPPLFSK